MRLTTATQQHHIGINVHISIISTVYASDAHDDERVK